MYGFQWPGTESRVKTFKLVFLHVALPLLTWIYIIFGACVFYNIEQPHEILVKNQNLADLRHLQNKTIGQFYDRMKFWSCRKDEELIERLNFSETSYMHFRLREFDELMLFTYRAFQGGLSAKDIDAKSLKLDWTFFSSIFFSTTVITTIGYGNLVPSTFWGKTFCIFYALIGIPLTLVTTADIGKFMATFIIWLHGVVSNSVGHGIEKTKKICLLRGRNSKNFPSAVHLEDRNSLKIKTIIEEKRDEETPLEENEVNRSHQQKKVSFREEDELTVESRDSFGLDQGFEVMPVPQSFVIFVLLGYTAVGAILFCSWEKWSFIDSFYFCLITMTTVGFGDMVPTHESYMLLAIVFIFVGLVLATMCIDTVGTHYIRRLHYFGRKIQTAQQVLAIIGGKALTLGDWIRHVKQVQNRFNLSDEQTRLIMLNPDEYANFVQEQQHIVLHFQKSARLGSFNPYDLDNIRFIDQIYDFTPRSEKCYRPSPSGNSQYSGRWLYF